MSELDDGIRLPSSLFDNARKDREATLPTADQREQAKEGLELLKMIAGQYQSVINALETGEGDDLPASLDAIKVSQHIATQNRKKSVEDGVCIVRFVRESDVHTPAKDETWVPSGIQSGLAITTVREKKNTGWKWHATGICLSGMSGEKLRISYKMDQGHSMDDVIDPFHPEIEITESKVVALAEVARVVQTCFSEQEISQQGGIIQSLINQAAGK